jgi:putative membrane protein
MADMPPARTNEAELTEASRRTRLAAERTWLAWWRTGLGATAVAVGVGRILPGLSSGASWPLRVLGLGYGLLAVAILTIGGVRQARVSQALRLGRYDELSSQLVMLLTITAVVLALGTLAVFAVEV